LRTHGIATGAGLALLLAAIGCGEPAAPDGAGPAPVPDPLDSQEPVSGEPVWAAGVEPTETFTSAAGLNLVAGGVGLVDQPATLAVDVPVAADADITVAAFYWILRSEAATGDSTVIIDGVERGGRLMASIQTDPSTGWAHVYKLGGQGRGFVHAGANAFQVSGLDVQPPGRVDGIGVLVMYRDPAGYGRIEVRNVPEFFHGAQGLEGRLHSFSVPTVAADSRCRFVLLAGDCTDNDADALWFAFGQGGILPGRLIGGEHPSARNLLRSRGGAQFDVVVEDRLRAPTGADVFAFQVQSPQVPAGDSGVLAVAALCLEPLVP
jgi:hypothetical protein